jgi:hypothetical protein
MNKASKKSRDPNYALQTFRKAKKAEARKKSKFQEYYESMCGPVTITYINK